MFSTFSLVPEVLGLQLRLRRSNAHNQKSTSPSQLLWLAKPLKTRSRCENKQRVASSRQSGSRAMFGWPPAWRSASLSALRTSVGQPGEAAQLLRNMDSPAEGIAYRIRFCQWLLSRRTPHSPKLSHEDISNATDLISRQVQQRAYPVEWGRRLCWYTLIWLSIRSHTSRAVKLPRKLGIWK